MPGYVIGDGPTVEVEGAESGGNTTFTVTDGDSITRAFVPQQMLTILGTTSTTVQVEGDWTDSPRVFLLTEPAWQTLQNVAIGAQGTGAGIVAPVAAGAVYVDSLAVTTGIYNSGGGYTAFAYPGNPADVNVVVLAGGDTLAVAATGTGEVRVTGNYDGATGYVGVAYAMALDLSRPADRREDGLASLGDGLSYGRTVVSGQFGGFTLTALASNGPNRSWTRAWVNAPGKLVAAVRGLADRTVLRISDGSPRPLRIVSAEINARRTRRIV